MFLITGTAIAQFIPGKVVFFDNTEIEGYYHVKAEFLLFKETSNAKNHIELHWKEVDYIQNLGTSEKKVFRRIKGKNITEIKEEIRGAFSFFTIGGDFISHYNTSIPHFGFTLASGSLNSKSEEFWFISKGKSHEVWKFGSDKIDKRNFKAITMRLFRDCPKLVEKIKNEEFGKKNIKEVIRYYNSNCSDNTTK